MATDPTVETHARGGVTDAVAGYLSRPTNFNSAQPTPTTNDSQKRVSSIVYLGMGGLLIVCITIAVTLWATGSFTRVRDVGNSAAASATAETTTQGKNQPPSRADIVPIDMQGNAKSTDATVIASGNTKARNMPPIGADVRPIEMQGDSKATVHAAPTDETQPTKDQGKNEAASTPGVQTIEISGELFVTTKGGDVKKAAGEKVYLTPITPEFENSVRTMLARGDQGKAAWDHVWKELRANPEKLAPKERFDREYGPRLNKALGVLSTAMDAALATLLAGASNTVANRDGKFKLIVPPGRYVFWTSARTMGEQRFSWCKIVEVRSVPLDLILSEDSVFLYPSDDKGLAFSTYRLLNEIANKIGVR